MAAGDRGRGRGGGQIWARCDPAGPPQPGSLRETRGPFPNVGRRCVGAEPARGDGPEPTAGTQRPSERLRPRGRKAPPATRSGASRRRPGRSAGPRAVWRCAGPQGLVPEPRGSRPRPVGAPVGAGWTAGRTHRLSTRGVSGASVPCQQRPRGPPDTRLLRLPISSLKWGRRVMTGIISTLRPRL